ncbi:MAG: hypothetical protein LBJ00_04905 [Planctomycetaceae bacterium]|nr:hypothetical protein [Planctomycetaceae bacterium]
MNNRFTLLRLLNALCCRFTSASGILKQLEHIPDLFGLFADAWYFEF